MTSWLAAALGALLVWQGAAPSTHWGPLNTSVGTGVIAGQVIDPIDNRRVPGAAVWLLPASASLDPDPSPALPEGATLVPFSGSTRALQLRADAEGRFVFAQLPAGSFTLLAAAPGYLQGFYGQVRPYGSSFALPIAAGRIARNISVPLWRLAVLTGRIIDEAGEPVVGTSVTGFWRARINGARVWRSAGTAITDDRGVYRLAGLRPGEYTVGVIAAQHTLPISTVESLVDTQGGDAMTNRDAITRALTESYGPNTALNGVRVGDFVTASQGPSRGGRGQTAVAPPPAPDGSLSTYTSTFVPGVRSVAEAATIDLAPGQEYQGADLRLTPISTTRVSGAVMGPEDVIQHVGVQLVPVGAEAFGDDAFGTAAVAAADSKGRFTFLAVPAGEYTIKVLKRVLIQPTTATEAVRPTPSIGASGSVTFGGGPTRVGALANESPTSTETVWWASVPIVALGNQPVTATVSLRRGLQVSGRVEFAGRNPPSPTQAHVSVSLFCAGTICAPAKAMPGRSGPDGRFQTSGYPAGPYFVVVEGFWPYGRVKSIVFNGRDISEEAINLTADVSDVVITVTSATSMLRGMVRTPDGKEDSTAEAVVFPADIAGWRQTGALGRSERFATVRVRQSGEFVFSTLAPGEYFVAAVAAASMGDYLDPAFLERVMRVATRVNLAEGETKTQDLRTVRVGR